MMMNEMMDGMIWGMGLFWVLILVLMLLAAAALVKYIFFGKSNGAPERRSFGSESRVSMRTIIYLFAALSAASMSVPSLAHHPGQKLDQVMGSKERYFQVIDKKAPDFSLQDADGRPVSLVGLRDKVVVLHFIYAGCPDVCPLHAERIAQVQEMIMQTPMKDRVRFVTITTDPKNDTVEVMREYGTAHGLKPENWVFLTTKPDQPEDATRLLAKKFGHSFTKTKEGYQAHGVVTHIIDRGGRWAANFHGLRFEAVNLVLYINGLTNNAHHPGKGGLARSPGPAPSIGVKKSHQE